MSPSLHLFSSPGENDIRYIIEASRPYLEGRSEATVAFLPLASLYAERWLEYTENSFKDLARLETINHRLHVSRLMIFLRKKVQSGLPVVAFSAGTILCGPNILTSKDMNTVATSHFEGLNVTPFNFSAHYPQDAYGQSVKDEWLSDYHFFHDNPVVIMSDGAYVRVAGRKTILVNGNAWILRKDMEKEKLEVGKAISL
jgi:peptidase E